MGKMRKKPVETIADLLEYYSFDLEKQAISQVVEDLVENYPTKWVIAAIIESIHQGRYKIVSVNNILLKWQLNGRPQHHFDVEFADLICSNLLKSSASQPELVLMASRALQTSVSEPLLPESEAAIEVDSATAIAEKVMPGIQLGVAGMVPNHGIANWLKLSRKL